MSDLYRLIYTSRDLTGRDAEQHRREVERILAASRRNNRRDGISGALLCAVGTFAQILEGPRAAVEATFERIQCDACHADIDVLQCEGVASRAFADWEMAFVGQPDGEVGPVRDLSRRGSEGGSGYDAGGARLDVSRFGADELIGSVLALIQGEQGAVAVADPAADSATGPATGSAMSPAADLAAGSPDIPAPAVRPFDADRLRAELMSQRPGGRVAPATPRPAVPSPVPPGGFPVVSPLDARADAGDAVLRAALDEERGRTTDLRRELDGARVALARARAEVESATRHRDIWADRGAQMRTSLRGMREALAAAEAERDEQRARAASHDAERDRLRAHRDIWAERARALASALCREPADGERGGAGGRAEPPQPAADRPALRSVTR